MESDPDPPNQPADFEWLGKYYIAANGIKGVFNDDFATVKRRLMDKNRSVLENSPDSNWFAKNIVKNFVQSVSKSMENLTELKCEVINELRSRYPGLKEEWLLQGGQRVAKLPSSTNSLINGYPVSQDGEHLRNGIVVTGGSCSTVGSINGRIDQSTVIIKNAHANNVDKCGCKTNDIGNVSNNNKNNIIGEESLDQESEKSNNSKNQNYNEQSTIIITEKDTDVDKIAVENPILPKIYDSNSKPIVGNDVADEVPTSVPESSPVDPPVEEMKEMLVVTSLKESIVTSNEKTGESQKSKGKIVIDDEVPGPSRLSHLSKRRLAKVTKRVFEKCPVYDSSDSDFDEPTLISKRKESDEEATAKSKVVPKGKPASRLRKGRKRKNTKTKLSKIDETDEEDELVEDIQNSEATQNYWKNHDYKNDAKLKMKPCVVLNRINIAQD